MHKVSILSHIESSIPRKLFDKYAHGLELNVKVLNPNELDAIKDDLVESDIVVGDVARKFIFSEPIVNMMKNLLFFQQPAAYFDNVDINTLKSRGVKVSYLPFVDSIPIAEHTMALAFVLLKRIIFAHLNAIEGRSVKSEVENLSSELYHKTWGIIGPLHIAKELGKRVRSLGMQVIYHTNDEGKFAESKNVEDVFLQSDVISLHYNAHLSKKVGEEELKVMKPTSIIVDVSRQTMLDQQALAKAILEGQIAGAGVDLVEQLHSSSPLLLAAKEGAPVVLTQDMAGSSSELYLRAIKESVRNVCLYVKGQEPKYIV
ncbi:MAG: NAD(P)-dependent oxidoreductase [Conexivisphaerales archaeon]